MANRRQDAWLDSQIAWLRSVVRVLTEQPAVDPAQRAQDAKDLVRAQNWLAELEAEPAAIEAGRWQDLAAELRKRLGQ